MVRVVKKPEERRREIVAASRKLFLRKGYENTKIQDVMTKLKIAKGTTYHYFKSKEELLEAVVEDMVAEQMRGVEKAFHESKGNALERLQALIEAGRVASHQPEMIKNLHKPDNRGMHTLLLAVTITKLAPLYAKVISQGCQEKLFQVEHPLECAEILIAGIQFLTDLGCYPWSEKDLQRRTHAIPSLIEKQLNAAKNSFHLLLGI